jgi:hypothetical protein
MRGCHHVCIWQRNFTSGCNWAQGAPPCASIAPSESLWDQCMGNKLGVELGLVFTHVSGDHRHVEVPERERRGGKTGRRGRGAYKGATKGDGTTI